MWFCGGWHATKFKLKNLNENVMCLSIEQKIIHLDFIRSILMSTSENRNTSVADESITVSIPIIIALANNFFFISSMIRLNKWSARKAIRPFFFYSYFFSFEKHTFVLNAHLSWQYRAIIVAVRRCINFGCWMRRANTFSNNLQFVWARLHT